SAQSRFSCDPVPAPLLNQMIQAVAKEKHVDAALMREIARQESAFHPCAVSSKGAAGLMQLMPETQARFDVQNPFDPRESLNAGASLLKSLLDRYSGDLSLALSAYNAGPSHVDRISGIPQIRETESYVSSILRRLGSPETALKVQGSPKH